MDSEHFSVARDFLYLAALFLGAGLGCILNSYRRKAATRFKNLAVVLGLCFFSGALAAFTAAVIISNWTILFNTALYLPMGVLAAILILAFRFPRAAGFPIIIISGVFVIWIGFAFLRFPALNDAGLVRLSRELNGLIHVWPATQSGAEGARSFSIDPSGEEPVFEFRVFCVSLSETLPLVGGKSRSVLTEIRNNNELLYEGAGIKSNFFPVQYSGENDEQQGSRWRFISFSEAAAKLPTGKFLPGTGLAVFFDGSAFVFRQAEP